MRLDLVALLLFLTAATGAVLIIERFRRRDTGMMVGIPAVWVKLSRIAFPLLLAVVLVRSFLIEPFHIPSGSMEPTLVAGDFILVDKTAFGMRIPDLNLTLISGGTPERGDVVVFRYPRQPGLSYIKRVVGLPGDHVMYRDGHLSLNGMEVAMSEVGDYYSPGHTGAVLLRETLGTWNTVWSGFRAGMKAQMISWSLRGIIMSSVTIGVPATTAVPGEPCLRVIWSDGRCSSG